MVATVSEPATSSVSPCAFYALLPDRFVLQPTDCAEEPFFGPCSTWTCNVVSYAQSVTRTGSGAGAVASSPTGINCPAGSCSASFASGTLVTLTATPNTNSTFTDWSGAGCNGTSSCTVTMSSASSVTATFESSAPACQSTCTCPESYSGTGDPGAFGGAVIIRLDRTVECSTARVHFLAEGTTRYGEYASFEGYIDIEKGGYTNQHTYNDYFNWVFVDGVSILDVQALP
ncbi:InlB B-repeat-containing protein [Archangium lipolyticum]|uniref:InlB B-repeat-containing protein n=1 Tax=Archangium lipolyticum TaxID=2970465 RepID=UPI003898D98F